MPCNCSKALHHFDDKKLQWLFAVWTCYIFIFVIFGVIIFGGDEAIEGNFDKAKSFGPSILETRFCLAPVML